MPEKPRRIQRKRTKGWRMPPNTVYVGRPSKWGNPRDWREWIRVSRDQTDARRSATIVFWDAMLAGEKSVHWRPAIQWMREHLHELRGKNLACWCKPDEPCHADVLLELANR